MSYMKALLEKLIDEAPEGQEAVEVQIYFKTSSYVPTPKGPMVSNVAAGALKRGPVDGIFAVATKGEGPNRETVVVELLFEAEHVCRVDRVVSKLDAPRILPVGGLQVPR